MTPVCVKPWIRAHGNVLVVSNVELTSKIRMCNILDVKDLATVRHSGEWGCSGKCGLLFVLISWSVYLPLEAEIIPAFPVSRAAGLCQLHGLAIPTVKLLQHYSGFLGSCVSGPPGWWGWAAAAFPKIQLSQDLAQQLLLDSHREKRMGGSIPTFDIHFIGKRELADPKHFT